MPNQTTETQYPQHTRPQTRPSPGLSAPNPADLPPGLPQPQDFPPQPQQEFHPAELDENGKPIYIEYQPGDVLPRGCVPDSDHPVDQEPAAIFVSGPWRQRVPCGCGRRFAPYTSEQLSPDVSPVDRLCGFCTSMNGYFVCHNCGTDIGPLFRTSANGTPCYLCERCATRAYPRTTKPVLLIRENDVDAQIQGHLRDTAVIRAYPSVQVAYRNRPVRPDYGQRDLVLITPENGYCYEWLRPEQIDALDAARNKRPQKAFRIKRG